MTLTQSQLVIYHLLSGPGNILFAIRTSDDDLFGDMERQNSEFTLWDTYQWKTKWRDIRKHQAQENGLYQNV